jgi:hypothetical protein
VDNGASLERLEYCGSGCLQTKQAFSGQHAYIDSIADFNGDGVADVLTYQSVSPGNVTDRVLFGGASGLANAVTVPSVPNEYIRAVGDFNGDGKADLVRRGQFDAMNEKFVVYLGNGLGGFTESTLKAVFPLSEVSGQLDVADIDGDGRDDLVVTLFGYLAVYRFGDPSCSQGTCTYIFTSVAGDDPTFGDINGDGRDDFAISSGPHSGTITFHRSTGTGFTPFPSYQTITAPYSVGFRMGLRDIDHDGKIDFQLYDGANPRTWWSGTNDGGFPYQAQTDVPLQASGCRFCMGDIDGDGRLDAVSGNQIWFNTST